MDTTVNHHRSHSIIGIISLILGIFSLCFFLGSLIAIALQKFPWLYNDNRLFIGPIIGIFAVLCGGWSYWRNNKKDRYGLIGFILGLILLIIVLIIVLVMIFTPMQVNS